MASYIQQMNFGAPTALSTDTVGSDPTNSQNSFTTKSANAIQEIRYTVDPAATIEYLLYIRRLDQSKRAVGGGSDFLRTSNRPQTQMPFPLGSGFFQWVEWQLAGALTAQNYIIKYVAPLET